MVVAVVRMGKQVSPEKEEGGGTAKAASGAGFNKYFYFFVSFEMSNG